MNVMFDIWALATMSAVLLLLGVTFVPKGWERRRLWGEIAAGLCIAALPLIVAFDWPWPAKACLVFVQCWLIVLSFRLISGRLEPVFLRLSTQYNGALALALVSTLIAGTQLGQLYPEFMAGSWLLAILLVLSVCLALAACGQIIWTFRHYALRLGGPQAKQLPTVSVCIPARNETNALTECLMAVLASDYPKLEVLVLDDCSQDKTSQVIRSFAHDGVRFVQGDVPAEGWLGKNQAMKTLAEHATGEYILFMGVDTRLAPHSISRIIQYILAHKLAMVSVLPQHTAMFGARSLLSPLQYYWRIVLPITKRRIPVSSKSWCINADVLRGLGGFDSVRHKIVPEESFARRLHSSDTYRFIVSNAELGMATDKSWQNQVRTAFRIAYPTFRRQPLHALGGVMGILLIMALPAVVAFVSALLGDFGANFWLAASSVVLWMAGFGLVLFRTKPNAWFISIMFWPYILMQEIIIIITSMAQYEFGHVDWKGRNVCYPVISVPPHGFKPAGHP